MSGHNIRKRSVTVYKVLNEGNVVEKSDLNRVARDWIATSERLVPRDSHVLALDNGEGRFGVIGLLSCQDCERG